MDLDREVAKTGWPRRTATTPPPRLPRCWLTRFRAARILGSLIWGTTLCSTKIACQSMKISTVHSVDRDHWSVAMFVEHPAHGGGVYQ